MINKHKSNKIKENSNTVRHLNNGTDHRHSKSCCDQSSPARRTIISIWCLSVQFGRRSMKSIREDCSVFMLSYIRPYNTNKANTGTFRKQLDSLSHYTDITCIIHVVSQISSIAIAFVTTCSIQPLNSSFTLLALCVEDPPIPLTKHL